MPLLFRLQESTCSNANTNKKTSYALTLAMRVGLRRHQQSQKGQSKFIQYSNAYQNFNPLKPIYHKCNIVGHIAYKFRHRARFTGQKQTQHSHTSHTSSSSSFLLK
eukprot:c15765_g1_i1 orf=2-316(-)